MRIFTLTLLGLCLSVAAFAHKPPHVGERSGEDQSETVSFRENCSPALSIIDQEINNVRARLTTGGDVWWDGDDGRYIVPKTPPGVPEVSSIFAGAVWIGGKDPGGNLKMAAQTYGRSSGQFDFWPGPLNPGDPNYPGGPLSDPRRGTIGADTCAQWDRFFVVDGANIDAHVRAWRLALAAGQGFLEPETIPEDVLGWPARGNRFFEQIHGFKLPETSQGLAGFWDQDFDGFYEPDEGDYPIIEIRGCTEQEPRSSPDEMIFWIYNDAGNVHRETNVTNENRIQMEIQVQAFAYKTSDDINNMTFQRYKLINRAVETIDSTFFAMWVDPDLGCYTDDYVGSDTTRSLAYVYNVDQLDGESGCTCPDGINSYCDEVPILGVDYFRGPLDEFGEELGMSSFTYYNNNGVGSPEPNTTDPQTAPEYYNYISGRWRNGTPYTFGGSGYLSGGEVTNYAFTDSPADPGGWSMCSEGLPVGDRRTLQASGQFRLLPGAVNELIIGVVWVPDQEYPCPSITRLQKADDIAQDLFDACFELTRGPDAPDVDWIELDREIIAVFTNDTITSNNAFELYEEQGLGIPDGADNLYRFEGYKLFQLSGPDVSLADRDDPEKVRLVYQVDKRNGIEKIFNWEGLNPEDGETPTGEIYFVPELQVDGQNEGIRHTFRITEDQFSEGDRRLINHKKYYFAAVAYAFNEYAEFDPVTGEGQGEPYIEGDRNIGDGENGFYTVIPRMILDRNLRSQYGDGPVTTRFDGEGTGGNFLDINDETRVTMEGLVAQDAFGVTFPPEVTYKGGFGPLSVQVFNPLDVIDGEYELAFQDNSMDDDELEPTGTWTLRSLTDPLAPVIVSEKPIADVNEQIIREFGFSITVNQVDEPGVDINGENGFRGYAEEFTGENPVPWLFGLGSKSTFEFSFLAPFFDYAATESTEPDFNVDPNDVLTNVDGSAFSAYYLCNWRQREDEAPYLTPAWTDRSNGNDIVRAQTSLAELNNVDIILTSNKDLWSRCVVVETANRFYSDVGLFAEGERNMFDLRDAPSVTKFDNDGDGLPDVDTDAPAGEEVGMGWFPGYAIDVETGQRLNIFFGENSVYNGSLLANVTEGADMMWNPTDDDFQFIDGAPITLLNLVAGCQQYIYVTKTPYDRCELFRTRLAAGQPSLRKVAALKEVTWAGFPLLSPNVPFTTYAEGLIPHDMIVKLRVDNPYQVKVGSNDNSGYPLYRFRLEGRQANELDEVGLNEALQAINVVPNPYYGFSDYEDSQFETVVKITNLPPACTVTIYSLDGKFIRRYNRNEAGAVPQSPNRAIERAQVNPDLEWDLRNFKQIPVASGVYLIHVAAPGLGERTLKWFGVNRQFDPSGL